MSNLRFASPEHRDFFLDMMSEARRNDCYHRAFFYVMGIAPETRSNIRQMFDFKQDCIEPDGMHGGWQTSGTVRVCRLAFNLWNGYTALTLRDHPQIIDLISVLEQSGLQKQKEEVQALVGYIDGMEEKLSQMMDEMKEMRLEVGKLHDKGIRARCSQLADTVEGKVRQTKVMVSTAKENLISSAKQMVQTFREKGRSALCHAAQALHIPSVLSRMGRGFAHSEKSMGQLAVRLDSMREELHQAGGHIKNAGLALTGKEPQESKELSADKGVLAKLRSFVLSCGKVFSEMERDMALTVERINGGRSSVKTELQGLRSAQAGQRRQAASKEQAR